jgi:PAS domain S-box-containing protein
VDLQRRRGRRLSDAMSESAPPGPHDAFDGAPSMFDLLPVGAYRSLPDGRQLRANAALVRLNGYASEAEQVAAVRDIATEWYVLPGRRDEFIRRLERDGQVTGFVSEVYRHKTRERIWVSENAHVMRGADGRVLWYEGTVEDITERIESQAALARSEEHLRRITAQLPGMAYRAEVEADGRRRFVYVSAGVHELFGVTPEAVLADPDLLARLVHPDDRAGVQGAMNAARPGQRLVAEFRIRRPDGSRAWVEVHAASVEAGAGRRTRTGVMVDISARKEAEVHLRESEERWKLALEATGDGVWDWELDSGVERFSPRFLEMYGWGPGELAEMAASMDARTHPDDVLRMQADRQAHFDGRTPRYENEHRVQCRDGSWKWILSRGLVIRRAPDGRPLRMIGTHTDITARKQAQELQHSRDEAQAADRAKSQLLSRVSHELRTPLNAVLGFAQLLEPTPLDARQREWLGHVLGGGRHLLALVEDVLDLSSLQSGEMRLAVAEVDVLQTLDAAWTMVAESAQAAGITLDRAALPAAPVWARADGRRLLQIVLNLLSNAVKYNRPQGRIVLGLRRDGDMVELSVADTGAGLSAEQQALLFRPFERLGAERRGVQGSGLGLALARQLAQAMSGDITLASTPGVGSVFRVRLPAA